MRYRDGGADTIADHRIHSPTGTELMTSKSIESTLILGQIKQEKQTLISYGHFTKKERERKYIYIYPNKGPSGESHENQ